MSTFAIVSRLLEYPGADVRGEAAALLHEAQELPASPARESLVAFMGWLLAVPGTEAEREYVATFDFARRATLQLSFHRYGDRRQRGMAMVMLRRRYARAGWRLRDGVMPDELPVVLDFAARAGDEGAAVLAELRPAIEIVRAALHEQETPYALLLDAVCQELPRLAEDELIEVRRIAQDGPPTESVGLEPFAPPEVMPVSGGAVR